MSKLVHHIALDKRGGGWWRATVHYMDGTSSQKTGRDYQALCVWALKEALAS